VKTRLPKVQEIAVDIGGVFVADPWQAIILTPETGLAARLRVPADHAREAAEQLWPRFATQAADEQDYWEEFSRLIGKPIDFQIVRECEANVWVLPDAEEFFDRISGGGIAASIVSDNTEFWFALQLRLCPALNRVARHRRFLSFEKGARKSSSPYSLYMVLAYHTEPAKTLVIDDRAEHVARAEALGFRARQFRGARDRAILPEICEALE
jgi:hypothetical protein